MRLTRSVLCAEVIHIGETEAIEAIGGPSPLAPLKERAPLGEVAANQPSVAIAPKDNMAVGKKPKPKGGKKPRGKKSKRAEEENGESCHESGPEVLEDERRAARSPASDAAVEDLMKENNNGKSGIAQALRALHFLCLCGMLIRESQILFRSQC